MEERVTSSPEIPQLKSLIPDPPTTTTTTTTTTTAATTTATTTTITTNNNNYLTLRLPSVPGQPLQTYIVQIPKDQIYRVPPPENARFVENYRQVASKEKNKTRACCRNLMCTGIVLVVIGLLIGITLTVIYPSFTPKAPVFSVSNLHVKQHKDGSPPTYDITLRVKNPNEKMGMKYGSVADGAVLSFWTKTLGSGQFPSLYQNSGDSNVVHVKVHGPEDQSVPPNVQKSMNDKETKHQISLLLKFNSPLLLNVWVLKMWRRDMDVKCDFRVSTMGEGTKILKQQCNTNLSH
ncbi:hypothetical protein PTKIN_Ptkin08bG0148300 [Pterospermum kingtungense]